MLDFPFLFALRSYLPGKQGCNLPQVNYAGGKCFGLCIGPQRQQRVDERFAADPQFVKPPRAAYSLDQLAHPLRPVLLQARHDVGAERDELTVNVAASRDVLDVVREKMFGAFLRSAASR